MTSAQKESFGKVSIDLGNQDRWAGKQEAIKIWKVFEMIKSSYEIPGLDQACALLKWITLQGDSIFINFADLQVIE